MKRKKILKESQASFRAKRGIRDHIFILNALINNRLKRKKGKLYVAFIDFRVAFDKINRGLMVNKLSRTGIKGKMIRLIKGIYRKTTTRIKTEDELTEEMEITKGVKQGCPLSPILFNIAVDSIDKI